MQEKDKVSFSGTHPDSLYRVPLSGDGEGARGTLLRCCRVLRWPATLLAVCVVLGLFIYYVMPDPAETALLEGNSTYWEAGLAGKFRHRPALPAPAANFSQQYRSQDTASINSTLGTAESKTKEMDFENAAIKGIPDDKQQAEGQYAPTTHPVPVYPQHVTPDVQYGNEKTYPGSERTAKILQDPPVVQEPSLKNPYQQTKGDFALYVKDVTGTAHNAPESTDVRKVQVNSHRTNFTSGHSKLFGISKEDAERYEATTPNSLYNTRVSPTLPALPRGPEKFSISATIRTSEADEGLSCRSTSLDACRHILPYDLATPPVVPTALSPQNLIDLVPDFKRLVGYGCNPRLLSFMCYLLEPECTASALVAKKPCRQFCEDSLVGCHEHIFFNTTLETMLYCSLYSNVDCIPSKEPCFKGELDCQDGTCVSAERKCDGHNDCLNGIDEVNCITCKDMDYSCPQGACIPKRWLCDGYADCSGGEDEENCWAGPEGFVPHPMKQTQPAWLSKWADKINPFKDAAREGAESMLAPVTVARNHNNLRQNSESPDYTTAAIKGESESKELLMMSDSSAPARPWNGTSTRRPLAAANAAPSAAEDQVIAEMLEDLEKMVDAEKWWETDEKEHRGGLMGAMGAMAHASPCPAGELRCVDGRCIMFSQLCDGYVDCSDSADEDNCTS